MIKKIAFVSLVSFAAMFNAAAQDAPKAAAVAAPMPKISYVLTQMIGSETNNGLSAKSCIIGATGNAQYSRTNFKAQVEFALNKSIKIAPWVQERFEAKIDPASSTAATSLTGDNFRNRFYAGVNSSFAFDKAFNLALNLEYRNASAITSKTAGVTTILPEHRFTPYLTASGKVDALYYSLATDLPVYIDMTADGHDGTALELEGTYNAGYGLVLDPATTVKLEMNYYFDIPNVCYSTTTSVTHAVYSEMRPKVILVAGDLSPFVGFLKSTTLNTVDVTTNDILGATFGADVKMGTSATFNITADVGVDTYKANQPWVTGVVASIVIKG